MGTKLKPGKFDCYANAEPDEPMFVLLARDPLAPQLVRIWAKMRAGRLSALTDMFMLISAAREQNYAARPNAAKVTEAEVCASDMERWREARITKQLGGR